MKWEVYFILMGELSVLAQFNSESDADKFLQEKRSKNRSGYLEFGKRKIE